MDIEKGKHRPLGVKRWQMGLLDPFGRGSAEMQPIAPGAIGEVVACPQVACVGERLHVEFECAKYFEILDVRVGKTSLKLSADSIPADTYALVVDDEGNPQRHQDNRLDFPPMKPGTHLYIRVQNMDLESHRFRASILVREILNEDWEPLACHNCGTIQPRRR